MRPIPWERVHSIAVLAPSWVGDAVMCLPALAAIRRALPAAELVVMARPVVLPVFAASPLAPCLIATPAPRSLAALRGPYLAGAPAARPDCLLVFPNSFFAALQAWRTRIPQRVGYARDLRSMLLTSAVPVPQTGASPGHESFYYLELLRRVGLISTLPAEPEAHLQPNPDAVATWRARLRGGHPTRRVVAMHVGASYGTAKRWLPERFAAVAGALRTDDVQVVLIGGPDERKVAEEVRRLSATSAGPAVLNLAGETTLAAVLALLAACDLLVANDSGPMHLAGALGTPVVAIFGSTNELQTYPLTRRDGLQLLKAPGVECSPCKLRECPIDHRCMTRITVEDVMTAVRYTLAG
ncbi:MAG: lipopolysaccharide heptosyltransferase II [Terriglobales bacterium]